MSESYVYAISDLKHIKIGVARHPYKRLKTLSTGNASKLYLLGFFSGGFKLEKEIHNNNIKVRENGEWLYPTEKLVEYLNIKIQDKLICVNNGIVEFYPKISL